MPLRGVFPWRLFSRFLGAQLLLIFILLGSVEVFIHFYFTTWLRTHSNFPEERISAVISVFDQAMIGMLLVVAMVFGAFSIWTGRRLVFPLGRLIVKARHAHRAALATAQAEPAPSALAEVDAADAEQEDEGEWFDLETALDRMRSDLRSQSETIAREREEHSTLMSAISDAILAVDREGELLFFNSQFEMLFQGYGIRERKPRLGELFRAPEVLNAFHGALGGAERGAYGQYVGVRLNVMRDPAPRYFSLSVAPLRRQDGAVYGAVGIFHDVTELKRAEQIRIDFVANVSHELRTPLTSIKGYSDSLLEDARQGRFDSARPFLEAVARNTDRLMNLINDLLNLSSLESGADLKRAQLDTQEVTERVLKQLEPARAAKDHELRVQYGAKQVFADPQRLEQVLINLLENAFKYVPSTSEKRGRVDISWESSHGSVLLRVADNGPGIPADSQHRLFERFYRVDQARSRELGGTGLGLAIVKHIMQRHSGAVWLVTEIGKGAEFVCQFPNA